MDNEKYLKHLENINDILLYNGVEKMHEYGKQ